MTDKSDRQYRRPYNTTNNVSKQHEGFVGPGHGLHKMKWLCFAGGRGAVWPGGVLYPFILQILVCSIFNLSIT